MKRFILLLTMAAALVSCNKTSYLYQIYSMMDLEGSTFHSDFGYDYVINGGLGPTFKNGRYMVSLAVTAKISETQYEADLINYYNVADKPMLIKSAIKDESAIGTDAVELEQAWISGGRMNLALGISFVYDSDKAHLVNLVFDDTAVNKDTIHLQLRHNAYGESLENKEIKRSALGLGTAYLSCPIGEITPKDRKSVVVALDWEWYKDDGYKLIAEHEKHRTCFKWDIE